MIKTNKEISRDVANDLLAPLIEYVLKRKDEGLELILKRLNTRLKWQASSDEMSPLPFREVGRAQLQNWLHPDPSRRIEPQFGLGLILLDIWNELKKEHKPNTK